MNKSDLISWHDGSYFHGNLKNNTPEGLGIYVNKHGKNYEGLWSEGFSYGLFRNWLSAELQADNYKFLIFFRLHIEMVNSFYDEVIAKLTRNDSPVDLAMTYIYGLKLIAFGDEILDELRKLLSGDFAEYSQSDDAGDRAYSCGGRFHLPSNFVDQILKIALSLEPFQTLSNQMLKIRSATDVYEKLMTSLSVNNENSIGKSSTWNERLIFHKTLNKSMKKINNC